MITKCGAVLLSALTTTSADAACPASPPISIKSQAGDQVVLAAWLTKTLLGKSFVFKDIGTEIYHPDGSYQYRAGNQK